MTSELDPSGAETAALLEAAELSAARVVEIGCGDGRLTRRYAKICRDSVAIDSVIHEIATAATVRPTGCRRRPRFLPATVMALPFRDRSFDIALLAWSL